MSALISRATSTVQGKCERLLNTIPKRIAYITLFATPYGNYNIELIDTFGIIYPIMLEVAFTATIFYYATKY